MTRMRTFFRWLLGKPATTGDPLAQALERFADPDADTLELIRHLVAQLRPRGRGDEEVAERYRAMLDREGYAGPADAVLIGDEETVTSRIEGLRAAGVDEYVGVVYDRSPEVRDRTRALLRALDTPGN